MRHIRLSILLVLLTAVSIQAQTLRQDVSLRLNHPEGIYAKGDTVRLWADVKAVPEFEVSFRIMKFCNWTPEKKENVNLKLGENLLWEGVFNEPVQYVFELTDGKVPTDFKQAGVNNVFAGLVVAPEEMLIGFDEPSDLRKYWKKEIKAMRKLKITEEITKDRVENGYRIYHTEINCVGPKSLQAYVAHPADAKPKSLPIIINLHAAGSPGAPSVAGTALATSKCAEGGALAMDLNAHGMLDDQPQAYYDDLNQGELKGYSSREPINKEDYYFKWMLLRAQRAVDYLTQNPLWDGKHIIVTGTSQGGFQSAFLAGVDKRVSAAVLTVPAGIDQGGELKGRSNSWPYTMKNFKESSMKNSPYFDAALLLKYTKADIWCEIGMYDFTCPAANLFAALNATKKAKKEIVLWQRPHSLYPGQTHGDVGEQRIAFMKKAAAK